MSPVGSPKEGFEGEVEMAACALALYPILFFPFLALNLDPSFAIGGLGQSTTQCSCD